MKKIMYFMLPLYLGLAACSKDSAVEEFDSSARSVSAQSNDPSCIIAEIAKIKTDPDPDVARVDEYLYQNNLVYAFKFDSIKIADAPTVIRDANCNIICTVGGIGDPKIMNCNGVNFYAVAEFKRNLYSKYK